jgi:hypothetical protein
MDVNEGSEFLKLAAVLVIPINHLGSECNQRDTGERHADE